MVQQSCVDDAQFVAITLNKLVAHLARPPCYKRLILLAGIQASGKSTLAKALAEQAGFTWISSDNIQHEVGNGNATVQVETFERYFEALADRKSIVFDAIAFTEKAIEQIVSKAQMKGEVQYVGYTRSGNINKCSWLSGHDNIVIVFFDTPLEDCLKRERQRKHGITECAIREAHAKLLRSKSPYSYGFPVVTLRPLTNETVSPEGKPFDYLFHDTRNE